MTTHHHLVIGSRGSGLALTQARAIQYELERAWRGRVSVEIKIIKTRGDAMQKMKTLPPNPGKGLFTKELEEALREKAIDLAVHSLKDLPVELAPEFRIAAVPRRASARDVLILRRGVKKGSLADGSVILTGSPRRAMQWLMLHPKTRVETVRGNIDTRLQKLVSSKTWMGLILAEAGLERLTPDTTGLTLHPLDFDEMLPAPGQGALGIEIRATDERTAELVAKLDDPLTHSQVAAERAFLAAMGGGCLSPIAAYAEPRPRGGLRLHGIFFSGSAGKREVVDGEQANSGQLGWRLAQKFQS